MSIQFYQSSVLLYQAFLEKEASKSGEKKENLDQECCCIDDM